MKHLLFSLLLLVRLSAGETLSLADLGKADRAATVAKLGAPESSYQITRIPAQMPGECLDYPLTGTAGVLLRLHRDRMAQVTIMCDPAEPATLLKKLGFTAEPAPQAGGTPIMNLYHITSPDKSKWEVKATMTLPGATTTTLVNLKPLP